ncbi:MAG: ABC transporter permease [Acidobacteriota bacterium]
MNRRLLWRSIWHALSRAKLRTFLMSLGIVIAVATLVVARAMGSGAEQKMLDSISRMFSASSLMVSARGMQGSIRDGAISTLTIADIEAIAAELDEVVAWEPFQLFSGQDVRFEGRTRQMNIFGISHQAEEVWQRAVTSGRAITADDLARVARVALIGTKAADALFGDEDPIGQRIYAGSVPLDVIGVLEPYGMDPHGEDRDFEIQVPISTLMRRLMKVDFIMAAKLVVDDPERVEEVADQVTAIMRERHQLVEGVPNDFAVTTPALVRRMVQRANRVLQVFLPAAAGVALLVAALVIASVMLMSVRQRVAEVGLRKAMGATDRQISGQFLTEAVAVTVSSALVGLAIGLAVILVASRRFQIPMALTADTIALALAASVLVGLLAGVLPARQAARLDPIAALK